MGQRWGIGPKGGEAFSSRYICRTILSVRKSIRPSSEGGVGVVWTDVCTEEIVLHMSQDEKASPLSGPIQKKEVWALLGPRGALGALNIAKHIIFGI